MQFKNLLALFAFTVAASANAVPSPEDANTSELVARDSVCFRTGEKFGGQRREAKQLAAQACRDKLSGRYRPGQERKRCVPLGNGKHVTFEVERARWGPRTLNVRDCKKELQEIIDDCSKGGKSDSSGWKWR